MDRAVIIDVVRSPFGKGREGGALSALHPVDLFAQVLRALVDRTGVDPHLVEDVIAGCVLQVGEQAANIARHAWLAAGLPETTPGVTLDRKCGSAQQAMDFAAQGVMAGAYGVVIAGGVEMMSRVPMKSNRMGMDSLGPRFRQRYPEGLVPQGISAELIASKWALSREALDGYALRSHLLAAQAQDRGWLARQMVSVRMPEDGSASEPVCIDEGVRRDTSLERLRQLTPAFQTDVWTARYPQIEWRVTAGNASQVTDGACAALICSERIAEKLRLTPRAAFSHFAVVGDDPIMMLTGIIPAVRKLLSKARLNQDDVDTYEVNEAFASVVLAFQKEMDIDLDRINPMGGAIAFGHPVGASGGRLMASLIETLERNGKRYGVQTMCESGGMANATLIERLG